MKQEKFLIFNADDFGYSRGVNRGILKSHTEGVVRSASLMVTGREVGEAVEMSRDHPELGIGLHWDVWGEDEREFDISDQSAVSAEFQLQLESFVDLVGRMPTHIDSHRHAHRNEVLKEPFRSLVEPLGLPLRGDGKVKYVGNFYAQWEWKVTNLEYVSVPQLTRWLSEEVEEGWTEFSCHPGYATPDWSAIYYSEREHEVRTLTDPTIRRAVNELGIRLRNYADFLALDAMPGVGGR